MHPDFADEYGNQNRWANVVSLRDWSLKDQVATWLLSGGTIAINLWPSEQGIKPTLSAAGSATQQIIQILGRFHGVAGIANGAVIRFLDELSRKPISKSAQHQAFRNRIKSATGQDHWKGHSFSTLVERNAVELGLEIQCTRCS